MLGSLDISRLYEKVLDNDMLMYNISEEAIKFGIECMAHVYKPNDTIPSLNSERSKIADYSDPAHRCAYLHKYAALHTAMVRDMLDEAVRENFNFFYRLVFSNEEFKMCSLGGGPGTDVIGAMGALHTAFGYFHASATVVDYMFEWSYSFDSILKELGTGWYGAFGNNISYYLHWRYVGANLLKSFKPDVLEALSTASLVTMIKFTSAAACKDTYAMIRNIFTAMKPGGVLLFIDNDGGGFHKLILDAAIEFNFRSIFGPLRRENYLNNFFKKIRFGYSSCCKTTVSVHILQKPFIIDPYYANQYQLRPLFGNNDSRRDSLLGSPPTPYVYLGRSPDENFKIMPAKPLLHGVSPGVPAIECPQTPYCHYESPAEIGNRLGYPSAYEINNDFSNDENLGPYFVSPVGEIPQSPSTCNNAIMPPGVMTPFAARNSPHNISVHRPVIFTPDTQPRGGKRARMQGCLPLRISNFRHHIGKKVNKVKARARSVFKKKNKKNNQHPIFEL